MGYSGRNGLGLVVGEGFGAGVYWKLSMPAAGTL